MMTVNEMLALIPPKFRKATIQVQAAIEPKLVLRVACHENDDGSKVVMIYDSRLPTQELKAAHKEPPHA